MSQEHFSSEDFISLFALSPREEDEYSELRSELSQSQHEVNEDSRSMDQNSVSVPENQSTVVTADMGKLCILVYMMPLKCKSRYLVRKYTSLGCANCNKY